MEVPVGGGGDKSVISPPPSPGLPQQQLGGHRFAPSTLRPPTLAASRNEQEVAGEAYNKCLAGSSNPRNRTIQDRRQREPMAETAVWTP